MTYCILKNLLRRHSAPATVLLVGRQLRNRREADQDIDRLRNGGFWSAKQLANIPTSQSQSQPVQPSDCKKGERNHV